jgi:hypothetical protein
MTFVHGKCKIQAFLASEASALPPQFILSYSADNPDHPIEPKAFHARVVNDLDALKREKERFRPLPVIKPVDAGMIQRNFL